MKKNISKSKTTPKATNQKRIDILLKEYAKVAKKITPPGRRIRRKLRRLGYYLSKKNTSRK